MPRSPWAADGTLSGAEESPHSLAKVARRKPGIREGRQGRRNDTGRAVV